MAINPFEVASKYGYNAATFAGDQNFQSYWSNKTEAQLLQGLQARGDWYAGRLNLNIPQSNGNVSTNNLTSNQLLYGGSAGQSTQDYISSMFASGQTNAYNAQMALQQQLESMLASQKDMYQNRYNEAMTGLNEAMSRDPYADLLAEQERMGYQQRITDINNVNQQISDLQQQYLSEKNAIRRESKLETMTKGRMGLVYDNYIEQGTMLNNRLAILQNNLQMMDTQLDRFFNWKKEQRSDEMENYRTLLDMANSQVIALSKEERDTLTNRMSIIQVEQDRMDKERDNVRSLLVEAAQNGIDYTSLGITPNDNIDTIIAKLAPAMKAQYDAQMVRSGSGGGALATNTTDDMIFSDDATAAAYQEAQRLVAANPSGKIDPAIWYQKMDALVTKYSKEGIDLTRDEWSNLVAGQMGVLNQGRYSPTITNNTGDTTYKPETTAEATGIKVVEITNKLEQFYTSKKTRATLSQIISDTMKLGNVSLAVAKKIATDFYRSNWWKNFTKGLQR